MNRRRHVTRLLSAIVTVTALLVGTAAAASAEEGVDVSSWQHPYGAAINWSQVRGSGIDFAFIKATEGPSGSRGDSANGWYAADSHDSMAAGVYHYARPALPLSTAVDQARYFVSVTGTLHGTHDLPPRARPGELGRPGHG